MLVLFKLCNFLSYLMDNVFKVEIDFTYNLNGTENIAIIANKVVEDW